MVWLWPRGHCFPLLCDIFPNSKKLWLVGWGHTNKYFSLSLLCSMAIQPEEHHLKVGMPEPCGREGHRRDVAKQFLQFTGAEERGRGHWWCHSTGLQLGNCCFGITRDFFFFFFLKVGQGLTTPCTEVSLCSGSLPVPWKGAVLPSPLWCTMQSSELQESWRCKKRAGFKSKLFSWDQTSKELVLLSKASSWVGMCFSHPRGCLLCVCVHSHDLPYPFSPQMMLSVFFHSEMMDLSI